MFTRKCNSNVRSELRKKNTKMLQKRDYNLVMEKILKKLLYIKHGNEINCRELILKH